MVDDEMTRIFPTETMVRVARMVHSAPPEKARGPLFYVDEATYTQLNVDLVDWCRNGGPIIKCYGGEYGDEEWNIPNMLHAGVFVTCVPESEWPKR